MKKQAKWFINSCVVDPGYLIYNCRENYVAIFILLKNKNVVRF